ncbi:MAG: hypothetical protein ABSH28_14605 [Acidobacteriota bacterium]|jgi:hypothetical protein
MGNLLIVVPGGENRSYAEEAFRSGIRLAENLKSQKPCGVLETDFAFVASFPRYNGSVAPVKIDRRNGNWLVALGTWFHDAGFGSGNEDRLLDRLNNIGPDALARELEGFFVIATGDAAKREVTIITDIVGTLHCYSRTWDHTAAISTSSLVLAGLGNISLDAVGCQEFLATGAMYEDRTFYKEVRKLESATCYRYKNGTFKSGQRYWRLTDLVADSLDGAEALTAMRETVIAAARKITSVFPRPVCDLTGGYDSRGAVAALIGAGVGFCTTVSGPPSYPDVVISQRLARRLGLPHRYVNPGPADNFDRLQRALQLTDGEYDLVDYARIYEIHSELAASFDISINSHSGEMGRGYGWEILLPRTGKREPLDIAKLAKRRFAGATFDASIVEASVRLDLQAHFADVFKRINGGLTHLPNTLQYDHCMLMTKTQRWYGRIATSTNQIWPCLSFFLMRSVLNVMLQTSTRSRNRSRLFRQLFVDIEPALAECPLELGYPPMPVSWKTIYRFWPMVPLYGGKIVKRMRRYLPISPVQSTPSDGGARLRLWRDDAVQALLRSKDLLCAEIMEGQALERFIERSKQIQFPFADQWARLLSLECALQRLKAVRNLAGDARPIK